MEGSNTFIFPTELSKTVKKSFYIWECIFVWTWVRKFMVATYECFFLWQGQNNKLIILDYSKNLTWFLKKKVSSYFLSCDFFLFVFVLFGMWILLLTGLLLKTYHQLNSFFGVSHRSNLMYCLAASDTITTTTTITTTQTNHTPMPKNTAFLLTNSYKNCSTTRKLVPPGLCTPRRDQFLWNSPKEEDNRGAPIPHNVIELGPKIQKLNKKVGKIRKIESKENRKDRIGKITRKFHYHYHHRPPFP